MLAAAASLVVGVAGPAAAQNEPTVGAGTGGGFEYAPDEGDPCGAFPFQIDRGAAYDSDLFVLDHASTYDSVDTPPANYAGLTRATITLGPVVQAPQGARPGDCDGATVVPAPVPITSVTITGTAPLSGSVDCDNLQPGGTYQRVATTVVFDFVVLCDITGNVTGDVQDVPVRHVIVGEQVACPILGCVADPNATSVLETSFTAEGP